jgi:hypothetical protein
VSIRLYLGGLYFWAGFQKLCSRSFYNNIAPSTFYWVYDALDVAYERFAFLGDYVSEDRVFLVVSIIGVGMRFYYSRFAYCTGLETVMGAVFLLHHLVPRAVLDLTLAFNVFLHLYIVAFIGYKNGIMTFWAWNMMVMTLSQLVFAPDPTAAHVPFTLWHWFMLFLFVLFPSTVLFGKCPNGVLSHAYFAPGYVFLFLFFKFVLLVYLFYIMFLFYAVDGTASLMWCSTRTHSRTCLRMSTKSAWSTSLWTPMPTTSAFSCARWRTA